jgi:hypothetical protein
MSCFFQKIDPPPTPSPPGECVPPPLVQGGGHTRWVERGGGGKVNILEEARHWIGESYSCRGERTNFKINIVWRCVFIWQIQRREGGCW